MGNRIEFGPTTMGQPQWAAEPLGAEDLVPAPLLIDPSAFPDAQAQKLVVAVAGAAIAAVSIPITVATTQQIKKGTVLDFGGVKWARVSADTAIGVTAIPVDALENALVSGDTAYANSYGRRTLLAGTLIGRTFAERATSTAFGAADDGDDEFFIVAFTVDDTTRISTVTGVRPGRLIKENYLPDWATISADAALLAKLRAVYQCIVGVN